MKLRLLSAALLASLLAAGAASAAGTPVHAVLNGKCVEVKNLDALGALKSLSYTCTAKSSKFAYRPAKAAEPGTGASRTRDRDARRDGARRLR